MAGPLVKAAASMVGIDPNTFNDVAQSGHCLAGVCAVLAPAALIGPWYFWRYGGALLIVLFASWKEFIWDPRNEDTEVRGSDLEDWSFYILGALLALVAYGFCKSWT